MLKCANTFSSEKLKTNFKRALMTDVVSFKVMKTDKHAQLLCMPKGGFMGPNMPRLYKRKESLNVNTGGTIKLALRVFGVTLTFVRALILPHVGGHRPHLGKIRHQTQMKACP